jgi:fatty acid elongase 3
MDQLQPLLATGQKYLAQTVDYVHNFHFQTGKTWGTDGKNVVIWSSVYLVMYFLLKAFMKKRTAFSHPLLTAFIVLHNGILSLGSLSLLIGVAYEVFRQFTTTNASFEVLYCDENAISCLNTVRAGPINFYFWIFYLSKYYELLDTMILLIKKKEVIFLHVYHHFITIYIAWACMTDHVAATWVM